MEDAIFNNAESPFELQVYRYRKLFGLTHQEVMEEPLDQFFTNLRINAYILKKQEQESKHGK